MPVMPAVVMALASGPISVTPAAFHLVQTTSPDTPPQSALTLPSMGTTGGETLPSPGDAGQDRPGVLADTGTDPRTSGAVPARRYFHIASGYGKQVPLGFAVRQIVPHGVRVVFAADVDTSVPVDWQGGREWNKVLATTVAQAGDIIDVGHNKVAVRRRIR
ncbi:hypothetical protein KOEU_30080 [Komagataeibacter europaeus]|uniref:Uncharacterized protein n=1 Tax=Komagataeibacter europaeus TaxID=33995 RepID=A0A0M0EE08_KOMEU|nr:hypothetical protein KOEU_30080 [Komagataeibacter europaeus]